MVTAVWVTSLLAAGLTVLDQFAHPPSNWTAADRDRGYWVTTTVAAGLFCLGIVMAVVYLVGVRSRFGAAQPADAEFRKSAAPLAPARLPAPPPEPAGSRKLVIDLDDA